MNRLPDFLLYFIIAIFIYSCTKETAPEDTDFNISFNTDSTIILLVNSTFKVNVTPGNAKVEMSVTVDELYTRSPKNGVVTISDDGEIKAVGEGKVYVTFTNNARSLTFNVVVVEIPSEILISDSIVTLKTGKSLQLRACYFNEYELSSYGGLKWEAADNSVASVSGTGNVTALKEGNTSVKVSLMNYPEIQAEYTIEALDQVVYLAGECLTESASTFPIHWRNNSKQIVGNFNLHIFGMDYFNGNTSLVGTAVSSEPGMNTAFLVRNKSEVLSSETGAYARDVTHIGDDIYSCGAYTYNGIRTVALWKNSVLVPIMTGPEITTESAGTCIAASGSYIYVGGFIKNSQGKQAACYWKNNQRTDLMDGTANSVVNSIFADGTVIYAAGYYVNASSVNIACYWKDGTKYDLSPGKANSVFVSGNNLYIAGTYLNNNENVACYWKNGTRSDLPVRNDAVAGYTTTIKVVDGNEYIAGYYKTASLLPGGTNKSIGCYWRNGIRHDIPTTIISSDYICPYSSVMSMTIE